MFVSTEERAAVTSLKQLIHNKTLNLFQGHSLELLELLSSSENIELARFAASYLCVIFKRKRKYPLNSHIVSIYATLCQHADPITQEYLARAFYAVVQRPQDMNIFFSNHAHRAVATGILDESASSQALCDTLAALVVCVSGNPKIAKVIVEDRVHLFVCPHMQAENGDIQENALKFLSLIALLPESHAHLSSSDSLPTLLSLAVDDGLRLSPFGESAMARANRVRHFSLQILTSLCANTDLGVCEKLVPLLPAIAQCEDESDNPTLAAATTLQSSSVVLALINQLLLAPGIDVNTAACHALAELLLLKDPARWPRTLDSPALGKLAQLLTSGATLGDNPLRCVLRCVCVCSHIPSNTAFLQAHASTLVTPIVKLVVPTLSVKTLIAAVECLEALCKHDDIRTQLVSAGVVFRLISLLTVEGKDLRLGIAKTFFRLLSGPELKGVHTSLVQTASVEPIVKLALTDTLAPKGGQQAVARMLENPEVDAKWATVAAIANVVQRDSAAGARLLGEEPLFVSESEPERTDCNGNGNGGAEEDGCGAKTRGKNPKYLSLRNFSSTASLQLGWTGSDTTREAVIRLLNEYVQSTHTQVQLTVMKLLRSLSKITNPPVIRHLAPTVSPLLARLADHNARAKRECLHTLLAYCHNTALDEQGYKRHYGREYMLERNALDVLTMLATPRQEDDAFHHMAAEIIGLLVRATDDEED